MKSNLKWADGSIVKREVDLRLMLLLGPKTIDDLYPRKEKGPEVIRLVAQNGSERRVSKFSELKNTLKGQVLFIVTITLISAAVV